MATVLYPGSFDPIHLGHLDVVEQAVELFGHVTVTVMHNHEKTGGLFTVEQRMDLVRESAAEAGIGEHVAVTAHAGLAIDAAAERRRGLHRQGPAHARPTSRSSSRWRSPTTRSPACAPSTCRAAPIAGYISSRFVREIARYGGSVTHMVPQCVDRRPARAVPRTSSDPTRPTTTYDDDEYDDYDDIDDEYPEPGRGVRR